jgi:hypothetical protein
MPGLAAAWARVSDGVLVRWSLWLLRFVVVMSRRRRDERVALRITRRIGERIGKRVRVRADHRGVLLR